MKVQKIQYQTSQFSQRLPKKFKEVKNKIIDQLQTLKQSDVFVKQDEEDIINDLKREININDFAYVDSKTKELTILPMNGVYF